MLTLLDAKPPAPITGIRKYVPLPALALIIFLIAIMAGLLTFRFWDTREEHAVAHFMVALQQGNFHQAYQLWQPAPSYSFNDFIHDWGESGDYGKIRQYQILGSRTKGGIVIVTVQINGENPPLEIVVDPKTLGLAYSNF